MSLSRLTIGAAAALFASALSVDPRVHARAPLSPRPVLTHEIAAVVPDHEAPAIVGYADGPVDRDVEVEVTADPHGGHRVVLRRRGYLVSLRHAEARAAGEDWAALHLATRPGQGEVVEDRLVWEATRISGKDRGAPETTRGLVMLSARNGALSAELHRAGEIEAAGAWKSALASCAAHRDGLGGFSVLCRFAKGVQHVGVANVTAARALDDVWVSSGASPVVRLDLPYQAGGAAGRVVGFSFGMSSVALRVEASFPEWEPATLLFDEAQRGQPAAPR